MVLIQDPDQLGDALSQGNRQQGRLWVALPGLTRNLQIATRLAVLHVSSHRPAPKASVQGRAASGGPRGARFSFPYGENDHERDRVAGVQEARVTASRSQEETVNGEVTAVQGPHLPLQGPGFSLSGWTQAEGRGRPQAGDGTVAAG